MFLVTTIGTKRTRSGIANVHTLKRRVISDTIRRFTRWNHPGMITAVHIDCGNAAIGRLPDGDARA